MKKRLLRNQRFALVLIMLFLLNLHCKKSSGDKFCEIQRMTYQSVDDKEGMVGYYDKYDRWAIYARVTSPNNIDSRITGIPCDIPSALKKDGLTVKFSGIYRTFNPDEKITPQMGGDELYYLDVSNIEKK